MHYFQNFTHPPGASTTVNAVWYEQSTKAREAASAQESINHDKNPHTELMFLILLFYKRRRMVMAMPTAAESI
jgi:hypothetical protein